MFKHELRASSSRADGSKFQEATLDEIIYCLTDTGVKCFI